MKRLNELLPPFGGYGNPLDITAALVDTDGSETLSIVIYGVPAGATLSAGTRNTDGSWSLTAAQLAGLTMSVASAADITIGVAATATEAAGGSSTASTTS
ncbi:MAG: hypothetical protein HC872_02740 [Gammaproteobacteria bacterium]|nr:hypothetical protein [Gammaproteobacteria bacterium]